MKYWDKHPLYGEICWNIIEKIHDLLDIEFEYELRSNKEIEEMHLNFAKKLAYNLEILLKDKEIKNNSYIIPFLIFRYNIKISNEILSRKIKKLIKDGGALNRGYSIVPSNKNNNYNWFQSPYDYAKQLEDNWEYLMKGSINFIDLEKIVSYI